MLELKKRGAVTFDYGNNLRAQAVDAGVENAFDIKGFVLEYIRPLFCEGAGPFRWVRAAGTATLSWIAPTERVNNRPLINLAGFSINYGQTSGIYNNKITIQNPGITSYLVENLPSGTWHFVISAIDSWGRSSEPSNERSIAIP